jgi:hypothetical protein
MVRCTLMRSANSSWLRPRFTRPILILTAERLEVGTALVGVPAGRHAGPVHELDHQTRNSLVGGRGGWSGRCHAPCSRCCSMYNRAAALPASPLAPVSALPTNTS